MRVTVVAVFTAIISVLAYMPLIGWELSIGIVLLTLIHEMGHAIAGIISQRKVPRIVFIPLLGGLTIYPGKVEDRDELAYLAFSGPLVGGATGIITFLIWLYYPARELWMMACVGLIINLFNLIPFSIFDGARILYATKRIDKTDWFDLPEISRKDRIKWRVLYSILFVTLAAALYLQLASLSVVSR